MATLTEARAQLAGWEAASLALASGKEYSHLNRRLTRSDASEVKDMINFWQRKVNELEARAAGRRNPIAAIAAFPDRTIHR